MKIQNSCFLPILKIFMRYIEFAANYVLFLNILVKIKGRVVVTPYLTYYGWLKNPYLHQFILNGHIQPILIKITFLQ